MGKSTKSKKHKKPEISLDSLYGHLADVETIAKKLAKEMEAVSECSDFSNLAQVYETIHYLNDVHLCHASIYIDRLEEATLAALTKACKATSCAA
jgi:excinuclease UvrABC nuclease subunit